jgi:aromatic ring-cleaving dioxygenase
MDLASMNGHLHIVKWLHENRKEGCSDKVMDLAIRNGHFDVVEWLFQNRKEFNLISAIANSRVYHQEEIQHWLEQKLSSTGY